MKLKKLIAHTILDVVEVDLELALRLVKRTGIYKRGLKASFEAAKMPLSDQLLTSLEEENIAAWEERLTSITLALREAIDTGSLHQIAVGRRQWNDRAWAQEEPAQEAVSKDAN